MGDFYIFASNYGRVSGNVGFNRLTDFNNDGTVDMMDFFIFSSNFGKTGAPRPAEASMKSMASDEAYEADTGGCNALLLRTVLFLIFAMFILPLFRKR